ncbi:ParB N-terminal domain-containing protein [Gellertiella hungarica]|uniref:ParB family chromosome partitioning protein n=1 Tax=Gellertiella hungarica TaxID=1572859 RepID=A0A7W6J6J4_9HYPH|nr:ParB N-terminal domain-containing protein [Gellertiella hungarica]MBB4065697.1 ParB family chromosome partitioning protein [Gellertiella hungarica]
MAELRRVAIPTIYVGERQRPIDHGHAMAIAASMEQRGLINPITVRRTPHQNNGSTPWTLVAGGHRLEAAKINGWTEIDVILVSADAVEAVLIELSENIFHNDLTAMNRAMFVAKFREMWEEANGQIVKGGDRRSKRAKCQDDTLIFAPGKTLATEVQRRLGIERRTYYRALTIALHLHPDLRSAIRGTKSEDDQRELLKLAKLDPETQMKIAAAMQEGADLKAALNLLQPKSARNVIEVEVETYLKKKAALERYHADMSPAAKRLLEERYGS